MSYSFDELFAIRLQFQDFTLDESLIIKKLKTLLLQHNIPIEVINTYLVDFYSQFGIDISLEDMSSINITENILGIPQDNPQNIPTDIIDLSYFYPITGTNFNIPVINGPLQNQNVEINNDPPIQTEGDEEVDTTDTVEITDSDEVQPQINQPEIPQSVSSTYSYTFNIPLNSTESLQQLNHFANIFNNILNVPPPPPVEPQDDIQITLDDECLNKLESFEVGNVDYDRCTICLGDIEQGNKLIKLKCTHYFHEDCLKEYLEEYDYKCPVCRIQVGKSKAHV